jgi:hypothetical protein
MVQFRNTHVQISSSNWIYNIVCIPSTILQPHSTSCRPPSRVPVG